MPVTEPAMPYEVGHGNKVQYFIFKLWYESVWYEHHGSRIFYSA
jgi:hypothetical protein